MFSEWFQFSSFAEFIQMGRYGAYVWSAYGIFAIVIIFNLVGPLRAQKEFFNEQQRRLRREQREK